MAAVHAHVEVASRVAQPIEVAHELVAEKGLAAGGEAHQDHNQLLAVHTLQAGLRSGWSGFRLWETIDIRCVKIVPKACTILNKRQPSGQLTRPEGGLEELDPSGAPRALVASSSSAAVRK